MTLLCTMSLFLFRLPPKRGPEEQKLEDQHIDLPRFWPRVRRWPTPSERPGDTLPAVNRLCPSRMPAIAEDNGVDMASTPQISHCSPMDRYEDVNSGADRLNADISPRKSSTSSQGSASTYLSNFSHSTDSALTSASSVSDCGAASLHISFDGTRAPDDDSITVTEFDLAQNSTSSGSRPVISSNASVVTPALAATPRCAQDFAVSTSYSLGARNVTLESNCDREQSTAPFTSSRPREQTISLPASKHTASEQDCELDDDIGPHPGTRWHPPSGPESRYLHPDILQRHEDLRRWESLINEADLKRADEMMQAQNFIRSFIQDFYHQHAGNIKVTCSLTMGELYRVSQLQEDEGVRHCGKLIQVPVIFEEVSLALWRHMVCSPELQAAGAEMERDREKETDLAGIRRRFGAWARSLKSPEPIGHCALCGFGYHDICSIPGLRPKEDNSRRPSGNSSIFGSIFRSAPHSPSVTSSPKSSRRRSSAKVTPPSAFEFLRKTMSKQEDIICKPDAMLLKKMTKSTEKTRSSSWAVGVRRASGIFANVEWKRERPSF